MSTRRPHSTGPPYVGASTGHLGGWGIQPQLIGADQDWIRRLVPWATVRPCRRA